MVEKSNLADFKSKIQNFLMERDKGKFDIKLLNSLPEKCLSTFEIESEELYENLNKKSLPFCNLILSKMQAHIEDSPTPEYSYVCALLRVMMHVDDSNVSITILTMIKM